MRWIALIALVSACVPAPAVLETPPVGGAKTAVYVVEIEGRPPFAYVAALDRANPPLPELARGAGERVAITAMHYGCTPEVLGLQLGVLPAMPEGEGHPLPPAAESLSSSLEDGAQSPWTAHAGLPAIRVPRNIACARYLQEKAIIPDTNSYSSTSSTSFEFDFATFGVATGDSELIVAISDGRFFRVSPEEVTQLDLPATLPHDAYHRTPDGELWLFGRDGTLAHGDFDRGFQMAATSSSARGVVRAWLTGTRTPGAPLELFSLTDFGDVERFDGTRWEHLFRFAYQSQRNSGFFGGITWVGPREVFAVIDYTHDGARWTDGRVSSEALFPRTGSGPSLRALASIPSLGTVVGTAAGRLFVNDGTGWVQLQDSPLRGSGFSFFPSIIDIAPLDEGVLFGGGNGRFAQYHPQLPEATKRYCDYDETKPIDDLQFGDMLAGYHISAIETLPCGYALLSKQSAFEADVEIDFITRIP